MVIEVLIKWRWGAETIPVVHLKKSWSIIHVGQFIEEITSLDIKWKSVLD